MPRNTSPITDSDVPQGNLFIVAEWEDYEQPHILMMTSVRERAITAFNDAVVAEQRYCDQIVMSVYALDDLGDYQHVEYIRRNWVGNKDKTEGDHASG